MARCVYQCACTAVFCISVSGSRPTKRKVYPTLSSETGINASQISTRPLRSIKSISQHSELSLCSTINGVVEIPRSISYGKIIVVLPQHLPQFFHWYNQVLHQLHLNLIQTVPLSRLFWARVRLAWAIGAQKNYWGIKEWTENSTRYWEAQTEAGRKTGYIANGRYATAFQQHSNPHLSKMGNSDFLHSLTKTRHFFHSFLPNIQHADSFPLNTKPQSS